MVRSISFRSVLLIAAAAWCALSLTACNTVRGVGKDIERAGEVIQGKTAAHPVAQPRPMAAP